MAKDPLLPDLPQDGDSWESLAGNLFGIDLNSSTADELPSAEDLESLEVAPPDPPAPEPPAVAETAEAPVDEASTEPVAEAPAPESKKPPRERDEEDTFWDPLTSWQWDDDDKGAKAAVKEAREPAPAESLDDEVEAEIVKGPGTDARRAAESFDTVSDYRTEYDSDGDDWEFGAGLIEGVPEPKPEKKQERTSAKKEEDPSRESKPRRRRESAEKSDREVSDRDKTERSKSDRDKPAKTDDRPPRSRREEKPREEPPPKEPARAKADTAEPTGDDFGAGLIDEPSRSKSDDEERPRERRSRRGGRRRRSSSGERDAEAKPESRETPEKPERKRVPAESGRDADDIDDDEPQEKRTRSDKKSPYRNIPTWETAISYLLNKSAASGSDDDERKQSERPRRRRRRRKPKS